LLYLPAYSPDFNPIEHHWARVKRVIRRHLVGTVKDIYEWSVKAFDEILAY
jgi:transposase